LDVRAFTGRSMDTFYHVRRPGKATGRTAVADLPENEYIKFRCENIALDTSMKIKWFTDIDVARNWLKCDEDQIKYKFQDLVDKFTKTSSFHNPEI
jgi:hypothetical protein